MNRQVIPSMILSVLIVCFFSILLYQRDRPAADARPAGGDHAPGATSVSASRNVDKPAAPSATASERPDASQGGEEGPQRDIEGLAKTEALPASTADPRTRSSLAAGLEGLESNRLAGPTAAAVVMATEGTGSALTPMAARPAGPVDRPQERPASRSADAAPASGAHRSAFTTVRDGETLQDVTIRVYGSSDQLDQLWRANRDVLPHKDSPLSAGAVLRTPEE